MLVRVLAVASMIVVVGLVLLWPERIRWTGSGSAAVVEQRLTQIGAFPLEIEPDAVIVIEGDSLVAGLRGRPDSGPPWPELLEQMLGGPRVINRGRGGHTAQAGEREWQEAPCADVAILLYGANDAGVRGWLLRRSGIAVDVYKEAMNRIIDRHHQCGSKVVIIDPLPPGSTAMARRLAPYRKAALQVAQSKDVMFLDPVPAWHSVSAPLQRDGLHLSAAGREALAEHVVSQFRVN